MTRRCRREKNVNFENIKWRPKDLFHSTLPIIILNWLTGLAILEYPLGKPRPAFTIIYVFLNILFYLIIAYYNDSDIEIETFNKIGENLIEYTFIGNLFITAASILINWYHWKKLKINFQRLELLDGAMEHMGLPNDYRKMFINSLLEVIIWIVTVCVLAIIDISALIDKCNWVTCLKLVYIFQWPFHLNSVVHFTFTLMVKCVGKRFENINFILQRNLVKYEEPEIVNQLFQKNRKLRILVKPTKSCTKITDSQQQIRILTIARYLHMELSNLSWEINKLFQIQMTMAMGSNFFIVTGLLYNLFCVIFVSRQSFDLKTSTALILWCFVYGFRTLKVVCTCAKVSKESSKSMEILYELKNENEDKELETEIEQFFLQLLQRPLVFSLCGFTTLNYSFIKRFIGTVTTYLVILIQLSPKSEKINK